jgi:hypothetical protein
MKAMLMKRVYLDEPGCGKDTVSIFSVKRSSAEWQRERRKRQKRASRKRPKDKDLLANLAC